MLLPVYQHNVISWWDIWCLPFLTLIIISYIIISYIRWLPTMYYDTVSVPTLCLIMPCYCNFGGFSGFQSKTQNLPNTLQLLLHTLIAGIYVKTTFSQINTMVPTIYNNYSHNSWIPITTTIIEPLIPTNYILNGT